jgi:anti-anti-sigma factor
VDYQITQQPSGTAIHISGSFTFNDNPKFKQIVELVEGAPPKLLKLEVSGMSFIDSAGLGMLLLLRDVCEKENIQVQISGAQGQVARIFDISRFDQLFAMS